MSQTLLETRVAALELAVAGLKAPLKTQPGKDWRSTIGMFHDDPETFDIFHEAMTIREEDRRRTRPKAAQRRKIKT
jgi:hypothetical protein